ncbi:MAG: TetR/AcrR family transcriptional regulator [Gordonia sp. (in: high G+C Gram-positive bacteria)]|uniref:TetR/AcrR family transcriptional regulator n=1 Tax=Gordonia sp. (in: high G+C Gram-positive bacteria) TaxID=84139 RepID=UPI0039E226C2
MTERKERVYGGVSAEKRREQRRAALIEAGLQLFGTEGYPNVPVKKICDEAGLTQRYFYESFSDREDLLAAVYNASVEELRNATLTGAAGFLQTVPGVADGGPVPAEAIPELARTTFGAFIDNLAQDPRRARVILIEVVGVSPALEQLRLGAIHDWASMILGFTPRRENPTQSDRLAAIGLVGAITQLLVDWQMAATTPISDAAGPDLFTPEAIHDVITQMMVGIYNQVFRADS